MITSIIIGFAKIGMALGLTVAAIEVTTNIVSMF